MRGAVIIQEDAVPVATPVLLQRQGDQIAESAVGQCLDRERIGRTNRSRYPADAPSPRSGCASRVSSRVQPARPPRRTATRGRSVPTANARVPAKDLFGGTSQ